MRVKHEKGVEGQGRCKKTEDGVQGSEGVCKRYSVGQEVVQGCSMDQGECVWVLHSLGRVCGSAQVGEGEGTWVEETFLASF